MPDILPEPKPLTPLIKANQTLRISARTFYGRPYAAAFATYEIAQSSLPFSSLILLKS